MPRRVQGFLSKTETKYLEFLDFTECIRNEPNNKGVWDENEEYHHRYLDRQIRLKTRKALKELCLVFEKVGFAELQSFFNDSEVMDNLRFINQTVEYVEVQKKMIRNDRETS